MIDDIRVSIIMPVYNAEDFLKQSIESVLEQDFIGYELILVDDCSTDNSKKILRKYRDENPDKIKLLELERNLRQGGARNCGLDVARGKYICFVDSDDWITPGILKTLYNCAEEHRSDLTGTNIYYRAFAGGNVEVAYSFGKKRNEFVINNLNDKSLNQVEKNQLLFTLGGICNNLFRKDLIVDNHIRFPEGLSYEDNYFMTMYLTYVNRIFYINEPYYFYRENLNSTLFRRDDSQLQRIEIEKLLYKDLLERGKLPGYSEGYEILAVRRWYLNTIPVIIMQDYAKAEKHLESFKNEFPFNLDHIKANRYYKREFGLKDRIKIALMDKAPSILVIFYKMRNCRH